MTNTFKRSKIWPQPLEWLKAKLGCLKIRSLVVRTPTHTLAHGAQRQSQLHLQQTRPHCVFTLFSFCHCLVSTCSITLTLTSSASPSQPDLSLSFSGSACFLLPIVHWLYATLIKLLATLCLFPVFNSNVLCIQLSLARFGYYQLYLWDHCCNCQVVSVWSPFSIGLSLPSSLAVLHLSSQFLNKSNFKQL